MRGRIGVVLGTLIALLAVPVAASAHPTSFNSFAFDAGGPAKALTQAPDDGGANFATSRNMRLLGFDERTPRSAPNTFGTFISDLAFWRDRVYQGTWDGFRILDADDPRRPRELLDYRDCANVAGSGQGDMVIWGSILVRTWDSPARAGSTCDGEPVPEGWEGVHVFDVSDPGNPDLVSSVRLACGSHTATGVPDLSNRRLMVYSTPSSGQCEGIDLVEVPLSRPSESEFLRFESADMPASANNFACHDTGVILGDVKKAACAGGVGFAVWSLGGKDGGSIDNPRFLYNRVVPEIVGPPNVDNPTGHSAAFSYDGETFIFGHEPGGGSAPRCQETGAPIRRGTVNGVQTDDMKSIFFFDLESGEQTGKWALTRPQTATENCTIHNYNVVPTRRGNEVLVHGSYQAGIGVLDFDRTNRAREVGYADPEPLVPTQLGGDWSSYYYNGVIYESDITRGLYTWRIDDSRVRSAVRLHHLNPQTQEFSIGARRDRDRWDDDDRWNGGDWDDDYDD